MDPDPPIASRSGELPSLDDPDSLRDISQRLRRLVRGLLDEHDTEEVVQETWLATCREPALPRRRLSSWMSGVALKLALELRRREGRRRRREGESARRDARRDPEASAVDEALLRLEAQQSVTDALMRLDGDLRAVVVLHDVEGHSTAETARLLGIPANTVSSRLRRARAILRARLDAEYGPRAWRQILLPLAAGSAARTAAVSGSGALSTGAMLSGVVGLIGAVVMSKTTTASVSAAVLGVAAGGWWLLSDSGSDEGGSSSTRAERSVAEAEALRLPPDPDPTSISAQRDAIPDPAPNATEAAPPRPAEDTPTTGQVEVRVLDLDGDPAADIGLCLHPWGALDPYVNILTTRTDDDGEALIRGVAPGSYLITTDRCSMVGGSYAQGSLKAGETKRHEISMIEGLRLFGTVYDENGQPVAGARLWLSIEGNFSEGFVVDTTDAQGRYAIEHVSSSRWIGARADGHAPSELILLMGEQGERELPLVLPGRGGSLQGEVVDAEGTPVPGARVQLGPPGTGDWFRRADGRQAARTQQRRARGDADGRFEFLGLGTGATPVEVRAPGFASWRGEVTIEPGRATFLPIELTEGFTVTGVVRDAAGEAVVGAEVEVRDPSSFLTRAALSKEGGRYRLPDLQPGAVELMARAEGGGLDTKRLEAEAGEVLEWDPVLQQRESITGVVVDEAGQGRGGMWLHAEVRDAAAYPLDATEQSVTAETDEDGRFEIPDRPDWGHRITLYARGSWIPLAVAQDVYPGEDGLRLVVTERAMPSARVLGSVLGPDDRPVPGAKLLMWSKIMEGSPIEDVDENGAFELGPVPAGTWTLRIEAPDFPTRTLPDFELAVGERRDLGPLRLTEPAVLVLPLSLEDGGELAHTEQWLSREDHPETWRLQRIGDIARSGALDPASYTLWIEGEQVPRSSRPVDLVAGENRLEWRLPRGSSLKIRVTPPRTREWKRLELRVLATDQTEVFRRHLRSDDASHSTTETSLALAAGSYEVLVLVDREVEQRRALEVPEGAPTLGPMEFLLD